MSLVLTEISIKKRANLFQIMSSYSERFRTTNPAMLKQSLCNVIFVGYKVKKYIFSVTIYYCCVWVATKYRLEHIMFQVQVNVKKWVTRSKSCNLYLGITFHHHRKEVVNKWSTQKYSLITGVN